MKPLKLANVGGIFLVTIAGCIVAVFVSCFELLTSAKEISNETKVIMETSSDTQSPLTSTDFLVTKFMILS